MFFKTESQIWLMCANTTSHLPLNQKGMDLKRSTYGDPLHGFISSLKIPRNTRNKTKYNIPVMMVL
jgi:hypothetical protein